MSDKDRPEGTPSQPTGGQPTGEQPPGEQPPGDQPTTAWTRPPEPPPPPPAPPAGEPATPYSGGSGPLLSATPSAAAGWAQPAVGGREVAPGLAFSGTAARFAAYVTDSFLIGLVGGVVSATVGTGAAFNPRGELVWTTGDFIASILAVVINGAYFVAFWSGGR